MIKDDDPIAKQLHDHFGTSDGVWPPGMTKDDWEAYLRLREVVRKCMEQGPETMMAQHDRLSNSDPQANYESIDFYDSDDPVILDFVRLLGFDTDTVSSLDIHIEAGQPVTCTAQVMPVAQRRVGSTWRSA